MSSSFRLKGTLWIQKTEGAHWFNLNSDLTVLPLYSKKHLTPIIGGVFIFLAGTSVIIKLIGEK